MHYHLNTAVTRSVESRYFVRNVGIRPQLAAPFAVGKLTRSMCGASISCVYHYLLVSLLQIIAITDLVPKNLKATNKGSKSIFFRRTGRPVIAHSIELFTDPWPPWSTAILSSSPSYAIVERCGTARDFVVCILEIGEVVVYCIWPLKPQSHFAPPIPTTVQRFAEFHHRSHQGRDWLQSWRVVPKAKGLVRLEAGLK